MGQCYKVLSLDVWGNETDGFDINNWFNAGEIEIGDVDWCVVSDAILEALLIHHLKPEARDRVCVECYGDGFYSVYDKQTGEPLYQLEAIESEANA